MQELAMRPEVHVERAWPRSWLDVQSRQLHDHTEVFADSVVSVTVPSALEDNLSEQQILALIRAHSFWIYLTSILGHHLVSNF